MATTTDKPTAAQLREQRDARVEAEQAKLAEARERAEREAEADAESDAAAPSTNGHRGGARVDPQADLFEQELENDELLRALDRRHQAKEQLAPLTKKYKEADKFAKTMIDGLDLEVDQTYRCGPFKITRSRVEGRSVAFETEETERLTIGLVSQD